LYPNVSEVTFQRTPRALSMGELDKSRFFTDAALTVSGRDLRTFWELDVHLVSRKPPFDRI
jgi:hypothetical protein